MTEKLTIKDLNCGNCGNQSTSQCPMKWEAFNGNSDKLSGFNSGNHSCGCLYHPLALQVLAAPVIEELEREIKDQRELQSHHRGSHSEVHRKMGDALEYAIQLLKGDVNIDPEIYICYNCDMFGCPIFMKDPKVTGCKYGPDIMRQIKASKKSKSRDFEEICKELGI